MKFQETLNRVRQPIGFPENSAEEMMECIKKGMEYEKRHQIKDVINDSETKNE